MDDPRATELGGEAHYISEKMGTVEAGVGAETIRPLFFI
jgi:hypothetical protein